MSASIAAESAPPIAGEARPRVSCIMPTRDRRRFVSQAVRYFLRQDYPDVELIVVDDGHDPVGDLIPDDARTVYIRLDRPQSIGAKRNIACRRASGTLIAHWDDDDWSAPHRLRRQVEALLASDADLCGLSELLHYRPFRADAWLYRGEPGSAQVAGCSILYRRSVWEAQPFPDTSLGEDGAFVGRLAPQRVLALADRSLLVAVVHDRNTSSLALGAPQWSPADLDETGSLMHADRPFYTALRNGQPYAPPAVECQSPEITVASSFYVHSGYGVTAEYLALSLARAGASVRALSSGRVYEGMSAELHGMVDDPRPGRDEEPTIYHSWIAHDFSTVRDRPNLYISTMFEASRLPAEWVPEIQRARGVIVPSTFVAGACRASGVTRPLFVVPLGADPAIYHWQPRERRAGLTTLIAAPIADRKNTTLAIEAWKQAFAGDPDASLIIKTTYGYHNYAPDDPRITYVDRVEPTRGIAEWYRRADILLALGNEGFGLPMIEAMATGLPVVALNAEGQADACRDAIELVFPVPAATLVPYVDGSGRTNGQRSIPDLDATVRQLRWIDAHRDEAGAIGREASAWAHRNRNIWSLGAGVLDAVQRTTPHAARAQRRTLWVTSAGKPCGVAAFTARLHRYLPAARVCVDEPALHRGGLLHVQHEPSLIDDGRMERFVARARNAGVTVAVTEHAVRHSASAWEPGAAALVAATTAGAAELRDLHPRSRVAHIPLGCETWSFPRKPRRGRTIGFFGFPGRHKGHARMVEALREVRGCDVVMYGYDPDAGDRTAEWPVDVAVRSATAWMPLAEIAAGLAAEADVVVFHYDEIPHYSASSAVLVGLAAGVPVLTSATRWFEDLGDAVHRSGTDAAGLARGLERLFDDDELRDRTTAAARDYCETNSWTRTAARHVELWRSLATQ